MISNEKERIEVLNSYFTTLFILAAVAVTSSNLRHVPVTFFFFDPLCLFAFVKIYFNQWCDIGRDCQQRQKTNQKQLDV